MNTKKYDQVKEVLSKYKGTPIDMCFQIYIIVRQSEKPAEILQYFYENNEDIESNEEYEIPIIFSQQEKSDLESQYGNLVDGILEKLIKKNQNASMFYEELWENINCDLLFETDKEKVFAMYYILIDSRIPYFETLEGTKMSNETFRKYFILLSKLLKKARFIISNDYEQQTERASLLLELFEEVDNKDEKIVLMSFITAFLSQR